MELEKRSLNHSITAKRFSATSFSIQESRREVHPARVRHQTAILTFLAYAHRFTPYLKGYRVEVGCRRPDLRLSEAAEHAFGPQDRLRPFQREPLR
jgi:hypothetical protein